MPAIHGSLNDKRFVNFHKLCELHNVEPRDMVSAIAENAMDDQAFFMNAVNRIKNNNERREL